MVINLPRNVIKGESMIMEMIKENNWKRPMYICVTVGEDFYPKSLNNYLTRTGLAYQIVPTEQQDSLSMNVDVNQMYTNMMTKFKFGGIENPKVYLDEQVLRMCKTHRIQFVYLIEALMAKGDTTRAKKALEYVDKVIPAATVPHDFSSNILAMRYFEAGMPAKGEEILNSVANRSVEYLKWYSSMKPSQKSNASNSVGHEMAVLNQVLMIADQVKSKAVVDKYRVQFENYARIFNMR